MSPWFEPDSSTPPLEMDSDEPIDIGGGFTLAEDHRPDGFLVGYTIIGPAGPRCTSPHQGRCGGLVPVTQFGSRAVWQVVSTDPLTLKPSVQCDCGDQHFFITNGRFVNAGGISE